MLRRFVPLATYVVMIGCGLAAVAGCNGSTAPAGNEASRPESRASEVLPAPAPANDNATLAEPKSTSSGNAGSPGSENTEDDEASEPTTYQPPFPERIELFAAPKRAKPGRRTGTDNEDSVSLLGFVRVDTPRAVLSIDGELAPVAEGDQRFGVEVISIQPPAVVLQRGRERWQASLAD